LHIIKKTSRNSNDFFAASNNPVTNTKTLNQKISNLPLTNESEKVLVKIEGNNKSTAEIQVKYELKIE